MVENSCVQSKLPFVSTHFQIFIKFLVFALNNTHHEIGEITDKQHLNSAILLLFREEILTTLPLYFIFIPFIRISCDSNGYPIGTKLLHQNTLNDCFCYGA